MPRICLADSRGFRAVYRPRSDDHGIGVPGNGGVMSLRAIDDPSSLRRVVEAMLLIEADLAVPLLLRHVVAEACSMTGARYGAIGVLDDKHTGLEEFITIGLSAEEEDRIGPRPNGRGVLGLLIAHPRPWRIAEVHAHPESTGFPANHPPMHSFLGVPIRVRGEVYGNLYLTDKVGWSEFTRDDQALVEALATAAGIAIENARLHQRVAQTAVYAERDRLARDLHDTIIQRLFAIGLSLQSISGGRIAPEASERLTSAMADIDDTIRQLRTTIFELGLFGVQPGLRASVATMLEDLRLVVGFPISASFDGAVDTAISRRIAEHLLPTIREAVTNIGRHAHASEASVSVSATGGHCCLHVTDNGTGMGSGGARDGGLGLLNMGRRVEKLGGQFEVEENPTGGTVLTWRVPLEGGAETGQ